MKSISAFSFVALFAALFIAAPSIEASDGQDSYASFWKCSDGNTYGLVANGNQRALYLPSGRAPIFFSGMKKGETYVGTIYLGNQQIPVSGPISNHQTRVTLWSGDGRSWVLDFSHK
ncbi:MAG: hypothetical protein P1U68_08975 [Verrucomicrobiales bacterium]|nr:hypothetical protein [Verrucomicrobiales bacterium]